MNFLRFLIYTTLGTTLWNLILTYIGRVLGENWSEISDLMAPYENGALVVLALNRSAILWLASATLATTTN